MTPPMTDNQAREALIPEAITEAFGERCPDFDPGCACCRAWAEYDALTTFRQHDEAGAVRVPELRWPDGTVYGLTIAQGRRAMAAALEAPKPAAPEAVEPVACPEMRFTAFESTINPGVWYVGDDNYAYLRTETGVGNPEKIAKQAAAGMNATPPVPEVTEAMVEAHKLLLRAADSFEAHSKSEDAPELINGYLESAVMYRDAATSLAAALAVKP